MTALKEKKPDEKDQALTLSLGYGLAVLSFSFRLNKLTAFSALFLYQPNSSPILQ